MHRGPPRAEAQPERCRRRVSAGGADLRHGPFGLRKELAPPRHALSGAARRAGRRGGSVRGDHGSGRACGRGRRGSDPRGPERALDSGDVRGLLRADSRVLRETAPRPNARLRPRPLFLQHQGRAVRGLPGRGRDAGRDAVPAGHRGALRRLRGEAVQPRDARGALSRPEHRGRARQLGRRGDGSLRDAPESRRGASVHGGDRPGVPDAGPARGHALGRRGAAPEAVARAGARGAEHPLRPRRADDGAAPGGYPAAARRPAPPRGRRQHGDRDRAQRRVHCRGRSCDRHGARGRGGRRAGRRLRHA